MPKNNKKALFTTGNICYNRIKAIINGGCYGIWKLYLQDPHAGSVLGMAREIGCISEYWQKPINGKIHTTIFGVGTVNISDCVEKTLSHIEMY